MQHSYKEKPWTLSTDSILDLYQSDGTKGLSNDTVEARQKQHGKNVFSQSKPPNILQIFLHQFTSPLIIILIVAVAITLYLNEWLDAGIIALAVLVNAGLGFYQEWKAERSVADLRSYIIERTRVIRNGYEIEVDAQSLVPGDILHITHGERITADARIIKAHNLATDESLLTGESLPVTKQAEILTDTTPLAERNNMIFAGTLAVAGSAYAVVTETGASTEIGILATLVNITIAEKTPLQKAVQKLTWVIVVGIGLVVSLIFFTGIQQGLPFYEMLIISIAVLVGSIPEALPIGLTAVLAIGVERIAKQKGIIRNLTAAETLGSTDVIITDKTGTLTEGRLHLTRILNQPEMATHNLKDYPKTLPKTAETILSCAVHNTDVLIENPDSPAESWQLTGNPLESSIIKTAGIYNLLSAERNSRKDELVIAFNSTHKFSVVATDPKYLPGPYKKIKKPFCILGAPDILLKKSTVNKEDYLKLEKDIIQESYDGNRVLGVAIVDSDSLPTNPSAEDIEGITFLGTLSFHDPVRLDVPEAIKQIESYGVTLFMSTGDLKGTALSVARELGWKINDASVLTGEEMRQLTDEELENALVHVRIFARVTPEDKLRITHILQKQKHIVAMTGDGVNDAPSLKAANIGIAVGSGSDVTKSVADLILLNDSFQTIVSTIEEGKRMLRNIKKILVYLLSNSLDEVILIGGSIIAGLGLPLTAAQIIWVNLFTGSIPALAYAFDTEARIEDSKEPKKIFDARVKFLTIVVGTVISILLFVLYYTLLQTSLSQELVRTIIFACFGSYILAIAFSFKNLYLPIYSYSLTDNKLLLYGVLLGFGLLFGTLYIPILQTIFSTVALSWFWLLVVLLWMLITVGLVELAKIFCNKFLKNY